jgi:hypothetical protein
MVIYTNGDIIEDVIDFNGGAVMKKQLELFFRRFVMSRKRYIIYGLILLIILFLIISLLNCKGYQIIIDKNTFNEFNKLMAQIIGTFTAILIGFYFVIFQMIETKRHTYFQNFREEVRQLKIKLQNIPNELSYIYSTFSMSVNFLDSILLSGGVPAKGKEDWEIIQKPIWVLIKKGFKYKGYSSKKNIFFDELFNTYEKIEDYLSRLGVLHISTFSLKFMLDTIIRLLFNVIHYIFAFLLFSFLFDNKVLINPVIPILVMVTSLYLSIVYISQFVLHIYDFYRNFMDDFLSEDETLK